MIAAASLLGAALLLAPDAENPKSAKDADNAPAPTARDASAPLEAASTDDGAQAMPDDGPSVRGRGPGGVPSSFTRSTALRAHIGVEPSAFEAASGVSSSGRWLASATAGYPWWGVRLQLGLRHGLSPLLEVQTALARRWRPAAGLAMLWVNLPRLRIGGEALLGWLFQSGELGRRGPNAELRVRIAAPLRRIAPYIMLGSQHTLLADRTTVIRAAGEERSWSLRGEWTGWGTVGVAVPITRRVGLDLGVDLTWVDAPETIAIPGAHGGIIFGGFRQDRSQGKSRSKDPRTSRSKVESTVESKVESASLTRRGSADAAGVWASRTMPFYDERTGAGVNTANAASTGVNAASTGVNAASTGVNAASTGAGASPGAVPASGGPSL